eukprot:TRINITY_DN535_c0_g1_i3.p1 TRINITY_DN535_c0_g1~~TRINITY_DN535_c0_g1_i3.p1  ORF type:complete len:356 (+),score=111.62 TRINITY_DN535_c0_g1_i3:1947-3014(+)
MNSVPCDVWREVFVWVVGAKDCGEVRLVCKGWDRILKEQMVMCCVHEYVDKAMVCRVVCGTKGESVGSMFNRCLEGWEGKGVYQFPHCTPGRYVGTGINGLTNPRQEDLMEYNPQLVSLGQRVETLQCTRLLLNERRVDDSFFGEKGSFTNYMRLLLRFQVKQQEYTIEHHARIKLLRTYIFNLEHRIACKLRLLLEHISYLCVKYMVVLLPYVESTLGSEPTPKDIAMRHILFRYRSVQDQVDRECSLVGDGYHAPIKSFKIPSLERYARFLCSADDSLETHVLSCKNIQPSLKPTTTRLPASCRLSDEGDAELPFPPPSDEPTIEAMLEAIISVCSAQRAFIKPELEASKNEA